MPEYRRLPNSVQFGNDIGNAGNDPILKRIMQRLDKYRAARHAHNKERQLRYLIEIYFCSNQWLGAHTSSKRRAPYLEALFRATVERLAINFECQGKLNLLPFKLEEYFGQKILRDKWEADIGQRNDDGKKQAPEDRDISTADATFLSSKELALRRLTFKNGKIYMWDWFRGTRSVKLVPANSANAGNPIVITPGFSGYALRMDREIFMTRHSEGHEGAKVAHSTYTAGQAVLCAGEIAIKDGRLLCVTTASGHYQPKPEKLLHVLEHFRSNGISMGNVIVGTKSKDDRDKFYPAREFLSNRAQVGRLEPLDREREKHMFQQIPGWITGSQYKMEVQGFGRLSEQEILAQIFA